LHYKRLHDDSEITNISSKYIVFLQDFVNIETFLRKKAQKRLKEGSKDAEVNQGKFVFNIDVLFAYNCFKK
jgi:vacuolar-type H+-ATPase subunit C/Vma6